ncbi:SWI/SNF complex subunit SMARCC2-like isoform X2 [Hydractinia symbiolongicarpus]|uniref:SWI/SNF complex subunit SMARCC2-like isoform X2 n=1 Tax=Hydractinia symbiolongicarpus TaxID=13093 RepID=UPI00254D70FD|nr:SWI/SNF complex subunit SMARCC2-like isoform X2 [Hydractinia symbiolongicarpus]
MAATKKDGGANSKYWDSPETIESLEPVRQWLLKNSKKFVQAESPSTKSLAELVKQMIQFQEDAFGKNISKPPLTRLSMKILTDNTPGGGLCHVLASAFKYKVDQGWRRFDFQSPSRMDRNVELFLNIERSLKEKNLLKPPKICFEPTMDTKHLLRLRDIVKRHQGIIVEEKSDATHIVHSPPSSYSSEEEWIRPIMKLDKTVLVHWWYYPDSYDSWIPLSECDQEPEPAPQKTKPWEVNGRWLLDMDLYNEWMNEEDYEVEDSSMGPVSPQEKGTKRKIKGRLMSDDGSSRKRKLMTSPEPNGKKKKKGKSKEEMEGDNDSTLELPDPEPVPNPTVLPVDDTQLAIISKVNAVVDLSNNTPANENTKEDKEEENKEKLKKERSNDKPVAKISEEVHRDPEMPHDDNLPEQTRHIVIPSYAAWFDYNSIHAIERRALPEFFNGKNKSKTPEIYMAFRNFMIDSYRLNPTEYLTATACRRNLAGDVCSIIRVHAFLEQWGLVNYQVDTDSRPLPMGPPPTSHFHALGDTPSGLQPLLPPKSNISASQQLINLADKDRKPDTEDVTDLSNFGLRNDVYLTKKAQKSRSAAYKEWTDQETLLLLEGLELHKDDWNKVSEHVGTRTQDECIMHFLKLPIEDPYLENDTSGFLGPLAYQPMPFSQSGNPVMSTVAFLSSIVDPRVASAAAKAAIDEFTKLKEEIPEDLIHAHVERAQAELKAEEQKKEAEGTEDVEMKDGEEKQKSEEAQSEEKPAVSPAKKLTEEEKEKVKAHQKLTDGNIKTAASAAIAAAAVKAKHLAQVEERKIKSLVALLVETQMKKLEIKLRHFEELETIMDKERDMLEQQRQALIKERQEFYMDQIKAQEARATKTGDVLDMQPHPPSATPAVPAVSLSAESEKKEDFDPTKTSTADTKIPGPDFLQHQMTTARSGGPSLSVLSPMEPKRDLTSSGSPAVTAAELLTAKAPVPLNNAQEEKKIPELPPYAAQPPPMPTSTGRGRNRGGRGRGGHGRGGQNNTDAMHQAYMANMPPYSGYAGFPGQQMAGMAPGMQGFQPNPMMQAGAGMMPNMNPAQFPAGQFPPGGQFPPM